MHAFCQLFLAYAIPNNFDTLPSNVQQLIFKLADNEKAASGLAYAVANNFDKLPADVQEISIKAADKDSVREIVLTAIKDYGNNIAERVRKKILTKLEEKGVT